MQEVYLAVDGGATKTFSVIYNGEMQVLGIGVAGPSNYRNIGEALAIDNINKSAVQALRMAATEPDHLTYATFAIAGVKDSDITTKIVNNLILRSRINCPYSLYNDGEAGFFSRFLSSDGIIIAPGTGMIAYSRFNGVMERASGWGWLIGDEGGAFYIGKTAINLFAKFSDGRVPADNEFMDMIREQFAITNDRDLVNKVYGERVDVKRVAALAHEVSVLSHLGNANAIRILKNAAREAALCGIALYLRLSTDDEITFSGYGGVYQSGKIYWDTLTSVIRKRVNKARFKSPLPGYQAVSGSILMHLAQIGTTVDEQDLQKIIYQIDQLIPQIPERDRKDHLFMA